MNVLTLRHSKEVFMEEVSFWQLLLDVGQAISQYYLPVMDQKAVEYGLSNGDSWLLLPALSFEPHPISPERLRIRSPYTSREKYAAGLKKLAEKRFLVAVNSNDGIYQLTSLGREATFNIIGAAYSKMETLQPLNPKELESLANQLWELVAVCLDEPEPPGKWSVTHSRQLDPGECAPVIVRIDQYLSDLYAYRDDSHLAAWEIHDINAHGWEMATLLWQTGPQTLAELSQRLVHRGFSFDEDRQALDNLVQKDWVDSEGEVYYLTRLGKVVRKAAEAETDRIFYRPFACLSAEEIAELEKQLTRLKTAL
jgi:DNA-binding PadR family transcriptional regulator